MRHGNPTELVGLVLKPFLHKRAEVIQHNIYLNIPPTDEKAVYIKIHINRGSFPTLKINHPNMPTVIMNSLYDGVFIVR